MEVLIDRAFEKDSRKLKQAPLLEKIATLIEEVISAETLADIPNLKKIRGFENYYRVRMGDYRIGVSIENNTVIFLRILHRKDIYRFFP